MVNQNPTAKMSKWTEPTNVPFFIMHKSAMKNYSVFGILAHAVWFVFSVRPFTNLVAAQVQDFSLTPNTLLALCAGFLVFVHIALYSLIKYAAYNYLDNDPNTVTSPMHYAAIVLICGSMFFLDVQGATATLRNEDKFEGKRGAISSNVDRQKAERIAAYKEQIETLEADAQARNQAIIVEYNTQAAKIASRKVYDEYDRKRRSADLKALDSKKATELAAIETSLAAEKKAANKDKNDAIAAITQAHNTASNRIDSEDAANASSAKTYGWLISLICLVLVIGCKIQEIYLRVKAGQKLISRISVADATGGFWAKLGFATQDISERIGHKLIFLYHNFGTKWTKELDELDGSFKVSGFDYSSVAAPTTTTAAPTTPTATAPPPPPPSDPPPPPPPSNPPPAPPAPPAPPSNGVEKVVKKRFADISEQQQIRITNHFVAANALTSQTGHLDTYKILATLNPEFAVVDGKIGFTEFWQDVINCSIKMGSSMPTFSELSIDEELDSVNALAEYYSISRADARKALNETDGEVYFITPMSRICTEKAGDVFKSFKSTPTPSVEAEKPLEIAKIGVAHQPEGVAHLETSKSDEMLEILRQKIQRYGKSHFEGSKANNETVFKHIAKACDEAARLFLDKKNHFSAKAIEAFETTAYNRLELSKQFGFSYDSEETLFSLIEKNKEVTNG